MWLYTKIGWPAQQPWSLSPESWEKILKFYWIFKIWHSNQRFRINFQSPITTQNSIRNIITQNPNEIWQNQALIVTEVARVPNPSVTQVPETRKDDILQELAPIIDQSPVLSHNKKKQSVKNFSPQIAEAQNGGVLSPVNTNLIHKTPTTSSTPEEKLFSNIFKNSRSQFSNKK